VRLVIENAQNGTYIIEASTDLLNWTPLSTNISDGGLVLFKDTAATNFNYRFYRARSK